MICTVSNRTVTDRHTKGIYAEYEAFVGENHKATCSAHAWDYAEAIEQAAFKPDDLVLDIGCASSYFGLFIADRVRTCYGIDDFTSYAFITYTVPWMKTLPDFEQYRTGKFVFVAANAARIPFPDNFFDKVVTFSALEHFVGDDDIDCAKEVGRVLKPGGSFLGTVDYNPVNHKPLKHYPICSVYTYRSLHERIVSPSCLRLAGTDFEALREEPRGDYVDAVFFHLVKEKVV